MKSTAAGRLRLLIKTPDFFLNSKGWVAVVVCQLVKGEESLLMSDALQVYEHSVLQSRYTMITIIMI